MLKHPHQLLFLLGLIHAFTGALYWILFYAGLISYPGIAHAYAMLGGFVLSFISGFILTAIPKFSGTPPAKIWEILIPSGLSLLLLADHLMGPIEQTGLLLITAQLVYLLCFYLLRWKFKPVGNLHFVTAGLILGLLGAGLWLLGNTIGKPLVLQDLFVCLILGIGQRLISALLGRGPNFTTPKITLPLYLIGVLFTLLQGPIVLAQGFRALAVGWTAIQIWKIQKRPFRRGVLPFWIWMSCWGLVLGMLFTTLVPSLGIHGAHFVLVGGIGLITLLVSTRVILAHGGHDLAIEFRSRALITTGICMVLAMLIRVLASHFSAHVFTLFAMAATFWLAALVIWSKVFVPRIIWVETEREK